MHIYARIRSRDVSPGLPDTQILFSRFFLLSLCFQSSLVVSKEEQDVTLIDGLIGDAHMQLHPYTIIHMVYFACIFVAYQILYSGYSIHV